MVSPHIGVRGIPLNNHVDGLFQLPVELEKPLAAKLLVPEIKRIRIKNDAVRFNIERIEIEYLP